MAIRIRSLRTFVAVAECGNLAAAARRLHRTPSAVSMTLKALETHLGAPLFEADRKARLTTLGRTVLVSARREIERFDEAARDMERHARGEAGRVAVACVPSVAMRLLPEVLRRFRALRPAVFVDVRDMDSESVHEALREARVDLGIASPLGDAGGAEAQTLLRDAFGVVCGAAHPLAAREGGVAWDELEAVEFIANGTCARVRDAGMRRLLDGSSLMVRNTTSLLALVAAGVGVTVLPRLAVDEGNHEVCFRALAAPVPVRDLVLLRRGAVTPSPAVAAFAGVVETVAAAMRCADGN